jgi:alkanesulfonate monooxygenase SsuD/methylene tetrahydromethanopterin reductase-like flavin-dependent oxidoreductase (luciferase family)
MAWPESRSALAQVQEYIQIVSCDARRKLTYEEDFSPRENFKLAFKPSGRTIPIYLAAFGPKMTRLAGRISDGVLINMANPAEIRRIAEEVKSGAAEAGKDPSRMEIICKIRCSIAPSYDVAREALSHALTYYALADYYRDLLGRMGFAAEVEAMRAAWKSSGFHAARKLVTDRMFSSLPLVAATSAPEVVEQIKPYLNAGATRVILPYVAASDDIVGEMKSFIDYWTPATTGLVE